MKRSRSWFRVPCGVLCRATLFATMMLANGVSWAQAYPAKPIRFIVGFAAGGGTDFVARVIAKRLTESLGQSIVVENRPGANGVTAGEQVARMAPDGYSILVGAAGSLVIAPSFAENPSDTLKLLDPIALVAASPFVLVTHPAVPARTLAEFISLARAQPGKLNYGSSGSGGAPHLAGELFARSAGVELVHVPYKGLAPALTDALAGQIQAVFADVGLALPHLAAGNLRPIGVTSIARSASLPDIPTIAEAGLAGYQAQTWYGLLGPAGMPAAIIERLNTEVASALASAEIRAQFKTQGLDANALTPAQFGAMIREDHAKWARLVREAKLRAN